MHARWLSTGLLLILWSCGEADAEATGGAGSAPSAGEAQPEIERLQPAGLLGDGWHPGTMLVVTDWDHLPGEPAQRATAEMLKVSLQQHGVVAAAELSWSRKRMPIDLLSVRVLQFADAGRLASWRQAKFGGLRRAKLRAVPGALHETYDVVADGKQQRVVFFDRCYVSSQHIQQGDDHQSALDAVCRQLLEEG